MPPPKALQQRATRSRYTSCSQRKVCKLCHNLDPRFHPNTVYETESKKEPRATLALVLDAFSLSRVRQPSEGGCRFCNVIVQALDAFFETWNETGQRVYVELQEKGTIKVALDGSAAREEAVELSAASACQRPWPTLGIAQPIPNDSSSDESFDFARRCIQDCLANEKHQTCHATSASGGHEPPKRLVDVGRGNSPIRIIETKPKTKYQYVTLSHCWGSTGPTLTATKANWQQLSSSISFEQLPPLFQDAVTITRKLGVRYIWIDSLCIIQDSPPDWQTESSKMSTIYSHSHVTLSATACPNSQSRVLTKRQPPIRITYRTTTQKAYALRARKILEHHPTPEPARCEPARIIGPIMSRAWVLQEHVLSARVLHYTRTELVFECRASFRCECDCGATVRGIKMHTTPSLIPRTDLRKRRDGHAVWGAWHRLVEEYSRRDLSVARDKLPAISGIAARLALGIGAKAKSKSKYVAGVWAEDIAEDLVWSVSAPSTSGRVGIGKGRNRYALEAYRAPSFSWASLDVPVSYYAPDAGERELSKPTVELVSSAVALDGMNAFGAVNEASLRLTGPCLNAILSSSERDGVWVYTLMIPGTSAIRISHDCLLVEQALRDESNSRKTGIRRARPGDDPACFKVDVLCLSVVRYDSWISGLVLGESERVAGAWERLGTFAAGTEVFQKAEKRKVQLV